MLQMEESVMAESYAESQKQLTKESITESLLLLLKVKDYAAITVTDLTRKAGVSRMAFYRNFKDKDQVLEAHFDAFYRTFFYEAEGLRTPTAESLARELVQYFDQYSGLYIESISRGYNEVLFRCFSQALGDFYMRTVTWDHYEGARAHYWNTFMAAGLFYILMDWIRQGKKESITYMAQLVTEMNT
jgi:AcrR family transcriptional regulator